MSLGEIGEILAGPTTRSQWRQVVEGRIEALRTQLEQMEAARQFLEHILTFDDSTPDGCEHYEALIGGRHEGD
jgi:hypothetical protein